MSNFNEDGSGDVFTFGTYKPIQIVQLRDSCTWLKYSQRVFPIDVLNDVSGRMISEKNNVDELFCQNILLSFSKLTLMNTSSLGVRAYT